MVLVFKGRKVFAEMAEKALKNNGIASLLKSEHGVGFSMKAGNLLEEYYIYVNKEDEDRAKEICMLFKEEANSKD